MIIDPYTWHSGSISEITRESAHAVSIRVELDHTYSYRPGEHAIVRIMDSDGNFFIRQYSFSGNTAGSEVWFTICEELGGVVSGWFNRTARLNDSIALSQPFTGPLSQVKLAKNICLIAGGSGIAPIMSYVRSIRATPQEQRPQLQVIYSTRQPIECFKDELSSTFDHETIYKRVTDTQKRFSESEIVQCIGSSEQVFICGSRPFVTSIKTITESIMPPEAIHAEAFTLH